MVFYGPTRLRRVLLNSPTDILVFGPTRALVTSFGGIEWVWEMEEMEGWTVIGGIEWNGMRWAMGRWGDGERGAVIGGIGWNGMR